MRMHACWDDAGAPANMGITWGCRHTTCSAKLRSCLEAVAYDMHLMAHFASFVAFTDHRNGLPLPVRVQTLPACLQILHTHP